MSDHPNEPTVDADTQRRAVRRRYGSIATASESDATVDSESDLLVDSDSEPTVAESHAAVDSEPTDCCGSTAGPTDGAGCCTPSSATRGSLAESSRQLGYSDEQQAAVDAGSNLGLGCGNPTAIAGLEPGQTVLDLGSGGGFDCFLAARAVGDRGDVIGVDMTPAMVDRARENARKNSVENVSFRLGEIEHLPVGDRTVDVIISNCVINLSPAKSQVFGEAFRVLRPGGRLAISDVVRSAMPPATVRSDLDAITGCVGDAATVETLETMLGEAGFVDVTIEPNDESREFIREWSADHDPSEYVVSATIEAKKPEAAQQKQVTGS